MINAPMMLTLRYAFSNGEGIPERDLKLYTHLKSSVFPAPEALLLELESLEKTLEQVRKQHNEYILRKKKQSYLEMLDDVYSGRRVPNFPEEIRRLTARKEHLRVFQEKYFSSDHPERLFDEDLTIKRLNKELVTVLGLIRERPCDVTLTVPFTEIQSKDLELCLQWANQLSATPIVWLSTLRLAIGDKEAARLLSARVAEKACINYYKSLGFGVEDISITQLENGKIAEWKDFDLRVGVTPIDVKNARASFSSPTTYVEHCIPRFKHSRVTQTEVRVAGVFSAYLSPDNFDAVPSKCTILGETSLSYARRLWQWMNQRFGEVVRVDGMWNNRHFPIWIFEYPSQHYSNLTDCKESVNKILKSVLNIQSSELTIPPWIFAFAEKSYTNAANISQSHRDILCDLQALRGAVGYTRPSLYLYILC